MAPNLRTLVTVLVSLPLLWTASGFVGVAGSTRPSRDAPLPTARSFGGARRPLAPTAAAPPARGWQARGVKFGITPRPSSGLSQRPRHMSSKNVDDAEDDAAPRSAPPDGSLAAAAALFAVAAAYWYLMVFAAAASSAGLPVPDFVPLTPGWPPSEADLAPAVEDSVHFFYLSDLLGALGRDGGESTVTAAAAADSGATPPTVRFAVFNLAEAWVFALLPALLADRRRLPLPVVLGTWLGALGLTNAFLAPYLAFREVFASRTFGGERREGDRDVDGAGGRRNPLLGAAFGAVAAAVVSVAAASALGAPPGGWAEFRDLAAADRTYTAFCLDLVLFSVFQPFILRRVSHGEVPAVYNVPFVGLIAWLFGA